MTPLRILILAATVAIPEVCFAEAAVKAPEVWCVAVGAPIRGGPAELEGCARNARELRNRLVENMGWSSDHVLVMDELSPIEHGPPEAAIGLLRATEANLDWAIKKWLAHRVKPGDLVLIYYAGRAVVVEDAIGGHALLATTEADKPWKLDAALDSLASRSENPIIVMLDTPHPEVFDKDPNTAKKARLRQSDQLLGVLTRWPGTSAWLSGRLKPTAPKSPGSPFLEALTQGLGSGDQARNLLGCLDVLNRNPRMIESRFQVSGGIGLDWTLWAKKFAAMDAPPSVLLLHGHSDRVTNMLTSADGSKLITASMDSTIKIWRYADGGLLHTLAPHTIGVTAMALSPDGTKLASGDGNGLIMLTTMEHFSSQTFSGRRPHEAGITSIAFIPDTPRFVSLDSDGKVVLWDASGLEPKPKLLAPGASAIACGDDRIAVAIRGEGPLGSIHFFRGDGSDMKSVEATPGTIRAGRLAIRDSYVASGDDLGHVAVFDLVTGKRQHQFSLDGSIAAVDVWANGRTVVGIDNTLYVTPPSGKPVPITMPAPIAGVSVSLGGESFAAYTEAGDLRAFTLEEGKIVPAAVDEGPQSSRTRCIAFAPRGDRLFSGDQNGGIRFWDWPDSGPPTRIAPHRGKIDALAVSPNGGTLLTIDHDRRARLMDLQEGRALRPIPGKWTSAAFLANGNGVAMTQSSGNLAIVDAATGAERPIRFERPLNSSGSRSTWGFHLVATSPDGKKIAAASHQGPLVCVWGSEGGALLKVIRDQLDIASSIAFAADSRHLMVASLDGSVHIWDLESPADRPRWTLLDAGAEMKAISSAAITFGPKKRVATGSRDGRLVLWELQDNGAARMVKLGSFEGAIRALAFTPDGVNLIAGGSDRTTRVWTLDGTAPFPPGVRLAPQHFEQVNAIVAIPNSRAVVSASDDSTLRFWLPDPGQLLGTLTADADSGQWVAFMKDGRFDSSPGGEQQVAWVRGDRLFPFEQFADTSRTYGLAKLWLAGEKPSDRTPISDAKLPAMAIDPPAKPNRDEVTITLRMGDENVNLEALRLYRNDIPVKDGTDFQATADPRIWQVRVELAPGENRLYAMGSRRELGSLQGRSNVVSVKLPEAAANAQGSLHILALGISRYDDSPLEFADRDAQSLTEFLRQNGIQAGGRVGHTKVLVDEKVTPEAVDDELLAMKKLAKPADTVVVFLAGHTDVRRDDRYCLLLSKFPLKVGEIAPNLRGPLAQAKGVPVVDKPSTILPFTAIERVLSRMNVANRLVVIDACQAEAIFDDPGVRRIREKTLDDSAHKIRTSYLLASRRGEGAKEAAVLRHGVLTHLLLRGMGAPDLQPEPGGVLGNADLDEDGVVTSEELRGFIDTHLSDLASRVETEAIRANPNAAPNQKPRKPDVPRVGSAATSFPLAKLPAAKK